MGSLNGNMNIATSSSGQVNWNEMLKTLINCTDGRGVKFTEETTKISVEVTASKASNLEEPPEEFHTPMSIRKLPELSSSTQMPMYRSTPMPMYRSGAMHQKPDGQAQAKKMPMDRTVQFQGPSKPSKGQRPPFRVPSNTQSSSRH